MQTFTLLPLLALLGPVFGALTDETICVAPTFDGDSNCSAEDIEACENRIFDSNICPGSIGTVDTRCLATPEGLGDCYIFTN